MPQVNLGKHQHLFVNDKMQMIVDGMDLSVEELTGKIVEFFLKGIIATKSDGIEGGLGARFQSR